MKQICNDCGQDKEILAKGLCATCYNRMHSRKRTGSMSDNYEQQKQRILNALAMSRINLDIATRASLGETYDSISKSYGVSKQRIAKIISNLAHNMQQHHPE